MRRRAGDLDDFWGRLTKLYNVSPSSQSTQHRQPSQVPSQQRTQPQPVGPQKGPLTVAEKKNLIHDAGQRRLMLEIKYGGVDRLVEPYSFRNGINGLLFFGYCSIHGKIHSFKLEKIEDIKISEFPFSPKWEVEL